MYSACVALIIRSYLTANGGGDEPNGDIGNAGAQLLIPNITDTRSMVEGLNLGKTITIGTADAGSFFNNEVLEQVDYGVRTRRRVDVSYSNPFLQMSNVHPWFANVSITDAAAWTYEFFQDNNVVVAQNLTNKPQMYIAETGWPSVKIHLSTLPSSDVFSGIERR